jgi:hypothetical protein
MSKRGQPRVYKRLTLTTLTTLIGLGGAAQAETYGGGPVFAGNTGTLAVCRVFNFGATPVTLPTLAIYNAAGANVAATFNNCPAPPADLPLGGSCTFFAPAVPNGAYSCRLVVVGPSSDQVSGAAEVQGPGGLVNVLPLRK